MIVYNFHKAILLLFRKKESNDEALYNLPGFVNSIYMPHCSNDETVCDVSINFSNGSGMPTHDSYFSGQVVLSPFWTCMHVS